MNILEAMDDPKLFAPLFKDHATWAPWRAFLAALFGLPMTEEQLEVYRACTGRVEAPEGPLSAATLVCGRRSGKSYILALIAVFLGAFRDYRPHLSPGEIACVKVIAMDRKQAKQIMRYVKAMLTEIPMLTALVEKWGEESVELSTRVSIEIATANIGRVRGYTICAALLDELAFWPTDDSANPDTEVITALKPAMATIPGAMLLCASSPYAKRGALWQAYDRYFGRDGAKELVWQAATRTMNPTVTEEYVSEQIESDPEGNTSEYLAVFRDDLSSLITREVVRNCTALGVTERPPLSDLQYLGFVDPSGGSADSFTLAIAHKQGGQAFLDATREVRPPFSPESVVEQFAELLLRYRITKVYGDNYGGEWPKEQFRKHGIAYELADKNRSELYLGLVPLLNAGQVNLLDSDRLTAQLVSLQRSTHGSGRDKVDHPRGMRDDLANSCAGVLTRAFRKDDVSWRSGPRQTTAIMDHMNVGSRARRQPRPGEQQQWNHPQGDTVLDLEGPRQRPQQQWAKT